MWVEIPSGVNNQWRYLLLWTCVVLVPVFSFEDIASRVLEPRLINLTQNADISTTSECGIPPEEFCIFKTAASGKRKDCMVCDATSHHFPISAAIDGKETWWKSQNNQEKVLITIDLKQEFYVTQVFVQMGPSPRPRELVLEKSIDGGITFTPLQYFASSAAGCLSLTGKTPSYVPTNTTDVICTPQYSSLYPLENGEIVANLREGRSGEESFQMFKELRDFFRATHIRLRFEKIHTFWGERFPDANQSNGFTRRIFYAVKHIIIQGMCICHGNADTCTSNPETGLLECQCKRNSCGPTCSECCPGFERSSREPEEEEGNSAFVCVASRCHCHGHSDECNGDTLETIIPRFRGILPHGGICKNCKNNTEGKHCEKCKLGFYRSADESLKKPCLDCQCNVFGSKDIDCDDLGFCHCKPRINGKRCDRCAVGYIGFPECIRTSASTTLLLCHCDVFGTKECDASGECVCYENIVGKTCDKCDENHYGFPKCKPCSCNALGSEYCDEKGGCICRKNVVGLKCGRCAKHHIGFPTCKPVESVSLDKCPCKCNIRGSLNCDCDSRGRCLKCLPNVVGDKCDRCADNFFRFPNCKECSCYPEGSKTLQCNRKTGQCECKELYAGKQCKCCAEKAEKTPQGICVIGCNCNPLGSKECDKNGQCVCKPRVVGTDCSKCLGNYKGFPECNKCDCEEEGTERCADGECICKPHIEGRRCDKCKLKKWKDLKCCKCDEHGTESCDKQRGICKCKTPYTGDHCNKCRTSKFSFPHCCKCDPEGTQDCKQGRCQCKEHFAGEKCDECCSKKLQFPKCCHCDIVGTQSCENGKCVCKPHITGYKCDQCQERSMAYPLCCSCNREGTTFCDKDKGKCECRDNVAGKHCDQCKTRRFEFPDCCHCNPEGTKICESGRCICHTNIEGKLCDRCSDDSIGFPNCEIITTQQDCPCLTTTPPPPPPPPPPMTTTTMCPCLKTTTTPKPTTTTTTKKPTTTTTTKKPTTTTTTKKPTTTTTTKKPTTTTTTKKPTTTTTTKKPTTTTTTKKPTTTTTTRKPPITTTPWCPCRNKTVPPPPKPVTTTTTRPTTTTTRPTTTTSPSTTTTSPPTTTDCPCRYSGPRSTIPTLVCKCNPKGTRDGSDVCDKYGKCNCKYLVTGKDCDSCVSTAFGFPNCQDCGCDLLKSRSSICDEINGQCQCKFGYYGRRYCRCDFWNSERKCDAITGQCVCKKMFTACNCNKKGSQSDQCDVKTGKCDCKSGVLGRKCGTCPEKQVLTNAGCKAISKCQEDICVIATEDNIDASSRSLENEFIEIKNIPIEELQKLRIYYLDDKLKLLKDLIESTKSRLDSLPAELDQFLQYTDVKVSNLSESFERKFPRIRKLTGLGRHLARKGSILIRKLYAQLLEIRTAHHSLGVISNKLVKFGDHMWLRRRIDLRYAIALASDDLESIKQNTKRNLFMTQRTKVGKQKILADDQLAWLNRSCLSVTAKLKFCYGRFKDLALESRLYDLFMKAVHAESNALEAKRLAFIFRRRSKYLNNSIEGIKQFKKDLHLLRRKNKDTKEMIREIRNIIISLSVGFRHEIDRGKLKLQHHIPWFTQIMEELADLYYYKINPHVRSLQIKAQNIYKTLIASLREGRNVILKFEEVPNTLKEAEESAKSTIEMIESLSQLDLPEAAKRVWKESIQLIEKVKTPIDIDTVPPEYPVPYPEVEIEVPVDSGSASGIEVISGSGDISGSGSGSGLGDYSDDLYYSDDPFASETFLTWNVKPVLEPFTVNMFSDASTLPTILSRENDSPNLQNTRIKREIDTNEIIVKDVSSFLKRGSLHYLKVGKRLKKAVQGGYQHLHTSDYELGILNNSILHINDVVDNVYKTDIPVLPEMRMVTLIPSKQMKYFSEQILKNCNYMALELAVNCSENAKEFRKIRETVDSGFITTRKIQNLAEKLENNQFARLQEKIKKKIEILKDKIEKAKRLAAKFKGDLHYNSPGFTAFHLRQDQNLPSGNQQIQFQFQSDFGEGTIFTTANETNKLLMKLKLAKHQLHFQIGIGDWTRHFQLQTSITDNIVYKIVIERFGKYMKLELWQGQKKLEEGQLFLENSEGMLSIAQPLFIGGYPDEYKITSNEVTSLDLSNQDFDGCIGEVQINNHDISLFAPDWSRGVREICTKHRNDFYSLVSFNGKGFVRTSLNITSPLFVKFFFRTHQQKALLIHIHGTVKIHYLSFWLQNGTVYCQYRDSKAITTFQSHRVNYHNGKWHHVEFRQNKNQYSLIVDGDDILSKASLYWNRGNLFKSLLVGDLDSTTAEKVPESSRSQWQPLIGCIDNITINGEEQQFEDLGNSRDTTFGSCAAAFIKCSCYSANSVSIPLRQLPSKIYLISFLFRTFGSKGTIMYYGISSFASVFIYHEKGVLSVRLQDRKVTGRHVDRQGVVTANDGEWHAFILSVEETSFRISVDEFTLIFKDRLKELTYSPHRHLMLGDDPSKKFSVFQGCFKDVAINDGFVDLSEEAATGNWSTCDK